MTTCRHCPAPADPDSAICSDCAFWLRDKYAPANFSPRVADRAQSSRPIDALISTKLETPPHSETPTSIAAAERKKPNAAAGRETVLDAIRSSPDGLTDEEIGVALTWDGNSVRPRRWELVLSQRIVSSGRTRPTRSGGKAVVWVAAKAPGSGAGFTGDA